MPRPKGEKKVRLNLEIAESFRARLDRLVERTEADSMTEVLRRAVIHYECALDDGHIPDAPVPPGHP